MINSLDPGQMHPFEGECNLLNVVPTLTNIENYVSKADLMDSFDSSGAGRRVGNVGHNDCDMRLGGDGLAWWLMNNVRIGRVDIRSAEGNEKSGVRRHCKQNDSGCVVELKKSV